MNGCKDGLRVLFVDFYTSLDRKYGLIVSNPPTFPRLPNGRGENGIDQAFFAGETGHEFIDSVADQARSFLLPSGKLFLLVPSYLDPAETVAKLKLSGLSADVRATIKVLVADYVREVSAYGLPGQQMLDVALRQSISENRKKAFELDAEGRPLAFWLSLIVATRVE